MKTPTVGIVFWRRLQIINSAHRLTLKWVRHEVRAVIDEHVVVRHWTTKSGGFWAYEVEHPSTFDDRFRPAAEPEATLDPEVAARLNRNLRRSRLTGPFLAATRPA